jgi:hypothetical protein
MTDVHGRAALLAAFDRLFQRAASKLHVDCTPEERDEAKRHFAARYDEALRLVEQAEMPEIPEQTLERMETAIDELSPAAVAAHLATIPLARHVHEALRQIALRAAEQKLLEHLAGQADDRYGGN